MSIVLLGSTSGSITLQEPAVAGTNTLSLPAATGTVATTADITSSFTGSNVSLTTNGYQKLPSGLIMQWCVGPTSSSESNQTINFPITFPTATLSVQVSTQAVTGADRMGQLVSFTTSSATVFYNSIGGAGGDITPYIFAIGY